MYAGLMLRILREKLPKIPFCEDYIFLGLAHSWFKIY
jgi:hypothetical protein